MSKLVYQVACSLDGFIADREGGYDWIVDDDTIDFQALYDRFDAFVMGRNTWETMAASGQSFPEGSKVFVVSTTLASSPGIEVIRDDVRGRIEALKAESKKDVWLFGGGQLLRSLLDMDLVDEIELALVPVLLGGGIPLVAPGKATPPMTLQSMQRYPSGIIIANYRCRPASA
jgi:dihydrofolate reductase